MTKPGHGSGPLILTLAIASVGLGAPAWADYEVMSATAPGFTAGQKLPDGAKLSVPAGKSLKLLGIPGGGTHVIDGPYEGTVADYEKNAACPWWTRLAGGCAKGEDEGEPAGTRGIVRPRE